MLIHIAQPPQRRSSRPQRERATLGFVSLLLAPLLSTRGCTSEATTDATPAALSAIERGRLLAMSPMPALPTSPSNAWADDEAAAKLGQRLFYDTGLSADGTVACATCHDPQKAFSDGRQRAKGLGDVPRHTPTVLLAGHQPWQFWDGRADTLWSQALGPVESDVEHGFDRTAVAHRIAATMRDEWQAVFGALPALSDGARFPAHARPVADNADHPHAKAWAAMSAGDRAAIDDVFARFGKAIEAYERRITVTPIALDAYVAAVRSGDDSGGGALSPAAQRGLRTFLGVGRCVFCHVGPLLSNGAFHNIGLSQPAGAPEQDRGRYDGAEIVAASAFSCLGAFSDAAAGTCGELEFLRQKEIVMLGAFKTPGLRSVGLTAPYMHAGQFATLNDVVDHYDHASDHEAPIGPRESFLTDIGLSAAERADLVALLQTFDAHAVDDAWSRPPQ